jgi:RHS repeat-associated protein
MKERSWQSEKYRYGFNGKENESDWEVQDYGFRIYKPEISKFLSVDPITAKFPMLTPYQFASNTPIQAIDLDGLEGIKVGIAVVGSNGGIVRGVGSGGIGIAITEKHIRFFLSGSVGVAIGKPGPSVGISVDYGYEPEMSKDLSDAEFGGLGGKLGFLGTYSTNESLNSSAIEKAFPLEKYMPKKWTKTGSDIITIEGTYDIPIGEVYTDPNKFAQDISKYLPKWIPQQAIVTLITEMRRQLAYLEKVSSNGEEYELQYGNTLEGVAGVFPGLTASKLMYINKIRAKDVKYLLGNDGSPGTKGDVLRLVGEKWLGLFWEKGGNMTAQQYKNYAYDSKGLSEYKFTSAEYYKSLKKKKKGG